MKKVVVVVAAILLAVPAFADEVGGPHRFDGRDFGEVKAEILGHFDARIRLEQAGRECVAAARDREEVKACFKKFRPRFQHRPEMAHP